MTKFLRQILIEFLWLIIALAATVLLTWFLFGWAFPQQTIDIHLHDTMFVISRWHILAPLFFLVTFIIYIIKESRESFKRTLPNIILVTIGVTLIMLLALLSQIFSQFLTGGWTLYPPLSALGPDEGAELTQNPATKFIANFLTAMQVIVVIILIIIAYQWGKRAGKPILK